jgi:hypothetical protein
VDPALGPLPQKLRLGSLQRFHPGERLEGLRGGPAHRGSAGDAGWVHRQVAHLPAHGAVLGPELGLWAVPRVRMVRADQLGRDNEK